MAIKEVSCHQASIVGGFWKDRQELNLRVTAQAVYDRFAETHRFEALKCQPDGHPQWQTHIYWDSDIAKWLEGAAYLLPNNELENKIEAAVDDLIANQQGDGYINSFYNIPQETERFSNRNNHELYCAGHLMEAACAYYEATGKNRFLKAMCRYADLIERIFKIENSAPFVTGGHPEVELALVRLYRTTGEKRYLELARYFLDQRGNNDKDGPLRDWTLPLYDMGHMPLKDQRTVEGHAVRAMYIASGMADIALLYNDKEYLTAVEAMFKNATEQRMYITGGLGSIFEGEAFTIDYDLPNMRAYSETCAALAMIFFARRMLRMKADSRYGDAIERVLYNGGLSGVSLDGKSFFYQNPLENNPKFHEPNVSTSYVIRRGILERVAVFKCSCCPPNIFRVIASMSDLLYGYEGDTLFVHQFAESQAEFEGCKVTQKTAYPTDGAVQLSVSGNAFKTVAVRIPGWCQKFDFSENYILKDGYAYITIPKNGKIEFEFDMSPTYMEAGAYVPEDAGKAVLMRGPIVYCIEGVDNGENLRNFTLLPEKEIEVILSSQFGVPILKTTALYKEPTTALYQPIGTPKTEKSLTFIPYFAFANRGETEMLVWINY